MTNGIASRSVIASEAILRQSGFAPGDDPVKTLVGAVTGKSNGAAVPAPAPETTNTADL